MARWGGYSTSPIPREEGEKRVADGDDFFSYSGLWSSREWGEE